MHYVKENVGFDELYHIYCWPVGLDPPPMKTRSLFLFGELRVLKLAFASSSCLSISFLLGYLFKIYFTTLLIGFAPFVGVILLDSLGIVGVKLSNTSSFCNLQFLRSFFDEK